jgi:YqaJ-like viral recombinase domain
MLEGVIRQRQVGLREEWLDWRKANINASEAAALFGEGVHPYATPYKLWADKSGLLPEEPDNPMKRRGRRLEPYHRDMIEDEFPAWHIWKPAVYLDDPERRFGATPDLYAQRNASPEERERGIRSQVRGIIQQKSANQFAFVKNWLNKETREVEVPLWIAVQASLELHLANQAQLADPLFAKEPPFTWAAVSVINPFGDSGVDMHTIDIPVRPKLIETIGKYVTDFWRRVADKDPYPIDWGRDVDTVMALYDDDSGGEIDLSDDPDVRAWLAERQLLSRLIKTGTEAQEMRKTVNAKIMQRMGNARTALWKGAKITAKVIKKKGYSVEPTEYRSVRVKGAKFDD